MRVRASLVTVAALVGMLVPSVAYADDPPPSDPPVADTPPPSSPVDVPPLVSEPLVIPQTTFPPVADYGTPPPSAPTPAPAPTWTPPLPPWLRWTPAQLQALSNLGRNGGSINIEDGPDGTLLIQDVTGYMVDNSPNPWHILDLNGSSTFLTPVSSESENPPSANSLAPMSIPVDSNVSLTVTNTWTSTAMVLISWKTDDGEVSRWKALKPGEVWSTVFDAPANASTSSLNLLSARGMSLRGFKTDYVKIVAVANPSS